VSNTQIFDEAVFALLEHHANALAAELTNYINELDADPPVYELAEGITPKQAAWASAVRSRELIKKASAEIIDRVRELQRAEYDS
jgi:hypothetical protein